MKGVVLAGGLGSRLAPMTRVVNKHLLDVYDEPMVHFPIRTLQQAGVTEIVIVTGQEIDQFKKLLGDGSELGVSLVYEQQEGEGGIADALARSRPHVEGDDMVVILGDNIFQENLRPYVEAFAAQGGGARVLLKRVSMDDARRFGVAVIDNDRIVRIDEKPAEPESDLVQTGCYMYDSTVFAIIDGLSPSERGELEITDVNMAYVRREALQFDVVPGWWTDAGTPASKLKASILVALAKGVTFQA
jgi:glucose-1-phosphate thymidylyltransferase